MRRLASTFAAALLLAVSPQAAAQVFPSKPITIVVPYSAGGGHDASARIVAERLAARLGQPVIVENKPGASGMIGTELVTRAPADGYTLLYSSPAEIVIAPSVRKSMRYDPFKDLAPITQVGSTPLVLVAHPSAKVTTFAELVARAKTTPLSFGTAGNGSSHHLAGAWINDLANIRMQHIPYKGAGPATNDLLGGQIPLAIVGMAPVLPHIRAGKLIPVAVMTPKRVEWAKDVPTVSESPGMQGFEVGHWMGLLAPAGTPPAVIAKIQAEVAAVLHSDEVRERFNKLGVDPVGSTTDEFRAFLVAEKDRFAKMFKLTGLQPE